MNLDDFDKDFSISEILFEDQQPVATIKNLPFFFVDPKKASGNNPERAQYLFTGTINLRKILEAYGIDPNDYPEEKIKSFKEGRLIGESIERVIAYWLNKHHAEYKGKVTTLPTMSDYDLAIEMGAEQRLIEVRLLTVSGTMRLQASKLGSTAYTGEKDSHKKMGLVYHTFQKVKKSFGYIFADVRNFQTSDNLVGQYEVYFMPSQYLLDLMIRGYFGVKGEKNHFRGEEDALNPVKTNGLNRLLSGGFDPTEVSKEKDIQAKLKYLDQTEAKIKEIDQKLEDSTKRMTELKNDKDIQALYFKLSKRKSIATKNQPLIAIIQTVAKTFRDAFNTIRREEDEEKLGNLAPLKRSLEAMISKETSGTGPNSFEYETSGLETLVTRTAELESITKKHEVLLRQREEILENFHNKMENVKGVYVSSVDEIENSTKKIPAKRVRNKKASAMPAPTQEKRLSLAELMFLN